MARSGFSALSGEFTPPVCDGHERRYRYTNVRVSSVCTLSQVRPGQKLELRVQEYDGNPDAVVVIRWKKIVGCLSSAKLSAMVRDWNAASLPVLARVSEAAGRFSLKIELSFYGHPHSSSALYIVNANQMQLTPALALLCEKQFIAFDVETTGLAPAVDRILEISAIRFIDGCPAESFSSLVNGGIPSTPQASSIHHITETAVFDAPDEAQAMRAFAEFLGEDCLHGKIPLVAYNAPFDSSFLDAAFRRSAVIGELLFCDALDLSRRSLTGLHNYQLQTVAEALNISQQAPHRAGDDASVCGQIMAILLPRWLACQRARLDALQPAELAVCRWVYAVLDSDHCPLDYLSFAVSGYLTVNCWHRVLRFKVRGKKPYVLVPEELPLPKECSCEPGNRIDGSGWVRVYFTDPEELTWLRPYLIVSYRQNSMEAALAARRDWREKLKIATAADEQLRLILP